MDDFDTARWQFAKRYFEELMREAGGVVSRAARIAGVGRTSLYRYLHYYEIPFARQARAGRGDWERPITPESIRERLGPPSMNVRSFPKHRLKIRQ